MEMIDLLTVIGGLMLSVIGYFLKRTMDELKEIKTVTYESQTKIKVLENDYVNKIDSLNQRIDMLYNSIEKLTDKIEKLSSKI
jgi:peptidoglycan hydrolase CwlO-like protein